LVTRYKHKKVKEKTEKKMEKIVKPEKLSKADIEYKGKLRETESVSGVHRGCTIIYMEKKLALKKKDSLEHKITNFQKLYLYTLLQFTQIFI